MPLPLVRNGNAQLLYPFQRSMTYNTKVAIFQNGAEQRAKTRGCLASFSLEYSKLVQSDKDAIRAAVASAKGTFDSSLSLTLGATTYGNLALEDDSWTGAEHESTQYGTALRLRQTKPQTVVPATVGTIPAFPALASGALAMRPYTQIDRHSTLRNDMESGKRFAYSYFGSGLTGMPTRSLKGWILAYSVLQDADVATLEAFFHWAWGRYAGFQYTDADNGTVYSNVRFDQDALLIEYQGFNRTSLQIRLSEFWV